MATSGYLENAEEILSAIASAIDRNQRNSNLLSDIIDTACKPVSPHLPAQQKVLLAIADLLPQHLDERVALTAHLDNRVRLFVCSSHPSCDNPGLATYVSGLWTTLNEFVQHRKSSRRHFTTKKRALEAAGDSKTKVVGDRDDERGSELLREERALQDKFADHVYGRCEGRVRHEIIRRREQFKEFLSFLDLKMTGMGPERSATIKRMSSNLNRYLEAIANGTPVIEEGTGKTLTLYYIVAFLDRIRRKEDFKKLMIPLSIDFRNETSFDLSFYLHKIVRINESIKLACIEAPRTGFSELLQLEFTITLCPPVYQTPISLPGTPQEWKNFLRKFEKPFGMRFVDMDNIVDMLLRTYTPAQSDSRPIRYHTEIELLTYLYQTKVLENIAANAPAKKDPNSDEDLFIATSHQPCLACSHYIEHLGGKKHGMPSLGSRSDGYRYAFPWQAPGGGLENTYRVKRAFSDEMTRNICFRLKKYGVLVKADK
ncbi:hypothetical protein NLJ89_g1177 [Agrocybe chaxingu]|uniref:Uncharacterized protein n=1 Tax=Agrocybe chaxingu TaxID=84603 RepID=A0A9W8N0J3_9AGAR|nr:hypothetical protein NLJ89_g1177 [Agrocybe chaxingu]